MEGQTIGSYRVDGKLGEGGMGVVYTGVHAMMGQRVAIKVLHPHLSHQQDLVTRFFNEARASTAAKHPGIISIFDFGWHDSGAYIVMELLEGETLATRLKRLGVLGEAEVVRLARQVAGALSAAHGKGIVHRDLKPDNIFIVRDEEVEGGERAKILDFGIAKLADSTVKTRAGSVMGTPAYMAPELCRGQPTDARIDIYALGCVIFEAVCGRPPFIGLGMGDVFAKHISAEPPTMQSFQAGTSAQLDAIVACALKKKPDDRFPTMADMMRALDGGRARAGTPTSVPVPGPVFPPTGPREITGPPAPITGSVPVPAAHSSKAWIVVVVLAVVVIVAIVLGARG